MRAVLPEFVGTFAQRPPAFSARKAGGVIAYQAARKGSALDLAPREVTIHAIQLLDATPGDGFLDVRLDIETGPGTYIRSLARDLGERLGSGGYLHALRRTEAAGLRADDGRSPDELEALAGAGRLDEALIPVERLLTLDAVTLDAEQAGRFTHGGEVSWSGSGRAQVHGPIRSAGHRGAARRPSPPAHGPGGVGMTTAAAPAVLALDEVARLCHRSGCRRVGRVRRRPSRPPDHPRRHPGSSRGPRRPPGGPRLRPAAHRGHPPGPNGRPARPAGGEPGAHRRGRRPAQSPSAFDTALRELPAETFLDRLAPGIQPVAVVMTPDSAFGRDRAGTPERLAELGPEHGFEVVVIDPELDDGPISSSRVREALGCGRRRRPPAGFWVDGRP